MPASVKRRMLGFGAVLTASLVLDQVTKAWARATLVEGQPVALFESWWHWRLSYNTGVAFSMFDESGLAGRLLLSLGALVATVVVIWLAARAAQPRRVETVALALVGSGALGNAIDRLALGHVTDFVAWSVGSYRWPVFNVADVALVGGVLLVAASGFLVARPTSPTPARPRS